MLAPPNRKALLSVASQLVVVLPLLLLDWGLYKKERERKNLKGLEKEARVNQDLFSFHKDSTEAIKVNWYRERKPM